MRRMDAGPLSAVRILEAMGLNIHLTTERERPLEESSLDTFLDSPQPGEAYLH